MSECSLLTGEMLVRNFKLKLQGQFGGLSLMELRGGGESF